jgi:predicted CXXCH cytochrome family protein
VSDLKRTFLVLSFVAALSLVFVGSAFANFGPHGGYISDTDSCAGCHRAHTSFSSLKYTPKVGGDLLTEAEKPSSLLVGGATTMTEFCNACHGAAAPGASTNVVGGVFDGTNTAEGGPSTAGLLATTTAQPYQTASTQGAGLNGGGFGTAYNVDTNGFNAVKSAHSMESVGVLWGAGNGSNLSTNLTCTSCHDPHGSSNYRLLKDSVNSVAVGGYTGDTPNGMVFSKEVGYADVVNAGGWLKHEDGQLQMGAYKPDYTGGTNILAGTAGDSLSTWCSACHTRYNQTADTGTGTSYSSPVAYESGTPTGALTANVGAMVRHRHPVDITLKQGDANLQINAQDSGTLDARIPLEAPAGAADPRSGQVGCLTCHFAHGSSYTMGGWAAAHLEKRPGSTTATDVIPVRDQIPGVDPGKYAIAGGTQNAAGLPGNATISGSSSLLRTNDRGVCERCHNK